MKSFKYKAMNHKGKVIYRSEKFRTYHEALVNGCAHLAVNKEFKEITVIEV